MSGNEGRRAYLLFTVLEDASVRHNVDVMHAEKNVAIYCSKFYEISKAKKKRRL